MNNSKFAEFKKTITSYYNENYNQYNDSYDRGFSDNNIVLNNALENFNELAQYYNTIKDCHILNDFRDQYGDMLLKDNSVKKLIEWLEDIDLVFEFEHDLIINKGCDYYISKQACLMYKEEEPCEQLDYWLNGKKLTDRQKNIIESDLCSYIDNEQEYLYIHSISFEFTLPKRAILRSYAEYKRAQR